MSNNEKKLARSEDDRWLAGVCGGLGHYFNIDPTIVRIIFVLFALFIGGGILVYLILWVLMPQGTDTLPPASGDADPAKGDEDEVEGE